MQNKFNFSFIVFTPESRDHKHILEGAGGWGMLAQQWEKGAVLIGHFLKGGGAQPPLGAETPLEIKASTFPGGG